MKPREFEFIYSKEGEELDDFFLAAGYDEIMATTSPFGRKSLVRMRELECGIKYIRIHNLFTGPEGDHRGEVDAGCNPLNRDEKGTLQFNWTNIDRVYDVLITSGYIPYIELGFMPDVLSSASIKTRNRWSYPPKDYDEWGTLVKQFVSHIKNRYSYVFSQFIFELWNEPDVHYFKGRPKEYNKLYDTTVAAFYDVLPNGNFKIGGPAVATRMFPHFKKFLTHCLYEKNYSTGETGNKLDFISFHLKGGLNFQKPKMKRILRRLKGYIRIIDKFKKDGKIARKHNNKAYLPDDIELHITELDPMVGCARGVIDNAKFRFRDTEYYSAYIGYTYTMLHQYRTLFKDNISLVFSDFLHFADEAMKGRIFAGCRSPTTAPFHSTKLEQSLQETRIIVKPVLKGFQLINKMRGRLLQQAHLEKCITSHVNAICTYENNMLYLLISNFNDQFNDTHLIEVSIKVHNLPNNYSTAEIHPLIVNKYTNNTYSTWQSIGRPLELSESQLSAIQRKEKLLFSDKVTHIIQKNTLTLKTTLHPHSLHFYHIFLN
ncbi:MAG: putative Xylan 1,4-beta-xylosidase [Promethearchaeota archaeon]|nr:MAG: putative Xylan 1,4-beta-xylosidase [Candidatus Lokiarchaeota archaeon]